MGILYLVLTAISDGSFFGFFLKATLPLSIVTGFLVKLDVDQKTDLTRFENLL
jgi:hypothetical protein